MNIHKNRNLLFVAQFLIWFLSILLFIWALTDPSLRDAEGHLEGTVCLPIGMSAALAVWGWATTSRLRESGFWFGLAFLGQAASLQLIEAGKTMSYQHYLPPITLVVQANPIVLVLLALQLVAVLIGFWSRRSSIFNWLSDKFSLKQLIWLGITFSLFAATISPQLSNYISEIVLATVIQSLNLLNLVLMVMALPEDMGFRGNEIIERWLSHPLKRIVSIRIDRLAMLAALWVFIMAGILSYFVYERHPHIPDEVAYVYQARFLAEGKLTMPAPPVREAFEVYLMQFDEDQWFPVPPVGWPAMLAVGTFLGVPWLVNPLLCGVNILLAFILVHKLYDLRTARLTVFFLAVSPWYIFMAMNYMTHTFTLTAMLISFVGIALARDTGASIWALIGGAGAGLTSLVRPLDGLIVVIIAGLWVLGLWGSRLKISGIALFGIGVAITSSLVFPYNLALTGSPTEFPIMTYTDEIYGNNSNAYGFGSDRGMGWAIDPFPGHGPLDALINADLNFFSINIELFGWSIGSLLFLAIFLSSTDFKKSDWLMFSLVGVIFFFHFFYYFSGGPDFGARYWYLMILPLVVMTVRGIDSLQRIAIKPHLAGRIALFVLALSVIAIVNFFPWRAIDKYYHYLGMRPDMRVIARQYDFASSLVFIRGATNPDYASAWINNPLDMYADQTLYAWDKTPEVRAQVLKAYLDRVVWLVDGPTITGRNYEVIAGPLSAQDFLEDGASLR